MRLEGRKEGRKRERKSERKNENKRKKIRLLTSQVVHFEVPDLTQIKNNIQTYRDRYDPRYFMLSTKG